MSFTYPSPRCFWFVGEGKFSAITAAIAFFTSYTHLGPNLTTVIDPGTVRRTGRDGR